MIFTAAANFLPSANIPPEPGAGPPKGNSAAASQGSPPAYAPA